MGVKNLHSYFVSNCTKASIQKTSFAAFEDKVIVVDISIYLYKFLGEDSFIEQLYLFLSLLRYYRIRVIFIFDGKPPPEKLALIRKRYQEKKKAEAKYDEIQEQIATMNVSMNETEYSNAVNELLDLRKKMVRLRPEHVQQSKQLIRAFGFAYYDAPGEADQLCAYFVQTGIAYACLSDDMDMFMLNCPRVLRNISMLNHSWTMYDTAQILAELQMPIRSLIEIVALSGNDYTHSQQHSQPQQQQHQHQQQPNPNTQLSPSNKRPSLKRVLDIYQTEYIINPDQHQKNTCRFYDWFAVAHRDELTVTNEQMEQIYVLYNTIWMSELFEPICGEYVSSNLKMNVDEIKRFMEPHGFVFIPPHKNYNTHNLIITK